MNTRPVMQVSPARRLINWLTQIKDLLAAAIFIGGAVYAALNYFATREELRETQDKLKIFEERSATQEQLKHAQTQLGAYQEKVCWFLRTAIGEGNQRFLQEGIDQKKEEIRKIETQRDKLPMSSRGYVDATEAIQEQQKKLEELEKSKNEVEILKGIAFRMILAGDTPGAATPAAPAPAPVESREKCIATASR